MGGRVGVSECRYPQTPEESIACPRTVATGDCEQLNMGAENQIQVLQKSNTLLATVISPAPFFSYCDVSSLNHHFYYLTFIN